MNEPDPRIAETSRGPVEYLLEGDSGPLLLGIHGAPGSCLQMREIFDRLGLTPDCCRRLLISRPGYAGTPLSSGETTEEQADLAAALLDFLGFAAADAAIPFSCGGPIALELARRHPEKVKSLLLLSSVTGPYPLWGRSWPTTWLMRFVFSTPGMALTGLLIKLCPRWVLIELLSGGGTVSRRKIARSEATTLNSPDGRAFPLRLIAHCIPFSRCRAGFHNDDAQGHKTRTLDYADLKLPVLIAHGKLDGDVPYSHAVELKKLLPQAELLTFERGCHLLALGKALPGLRQKVRRFCNVLDHTASTSNPKDGK